jgi:hypothetical protein
MKNMDLILQIWGGSFYLANKVLFSFAEGRKGSSKRTLKIAGWMIYLLGVPAWVIVLIGKHNWIAASIEAGGVPAMLFGLFNAFKNTESINKKFDAFASLCSYSFLIFGIFYSLYDYGGIASISQLLEMGVMVGFLTGSYLLAKSNPIGWLFFMLMNVSMASLMLLQHKPILTAQQLVSLSFVIYGFTMARKSSMHDS